MRRFLNTTINMLLMTGALLLPEASASDRFFDDGFRSTKKIESRYFNIEVESGVDLQTLTMKLSVPPSIKNIIKSPAVFMDSYTLEDQLDTLLLSLFEIMDIKLKNFRCTMKICKDAESISRTAELLFGQEITCGGFYVAVMDTVYIDAENINLHMLGHELSHAVQTHYFIVPPPEKIQEILSGYVEYQLRKYSNNMPNGAKR